ncbi:hypothetical protein AMS68_001471 [Peltaster fructicola]|uniref:J domain-containing protein n=1 Tax=Peltaster fructicola TaxID=286661 RepID=A0A6H0XMK4_9PEZI|nr:hypothetical protein AMS68_001471 [Peltaster fructicola]
MSSEYSYDADAQFFPFFVLTLGSIITLPLTYTLLRKPSDTTTARSSKIDTTFVPNDADLIDIHRAKQKRRELKLKRIIAAAIGWAVLAWMVYLIVVTAQQTPSIWNPYEILDIGMTATEKQINSRYRKLSITMHPDKRQPDASKNETIESVNDAWVEIVKAYKALTDEEVRNNYIQFGHPDGKQSTSFGIALPQFLIAEGNGKYVLVFYGALLGIGLPLLVGRWWYGMQKLNKERILSSSAGNMFREYTERMDSGEVAATLSISTEFKELLSGSRADNGLAKLEKAVLGGDPAWSLPIKQRRKLEQLDDATRRKTLALIWAYLYRIELDDRTLESEKYEIAPIALQLAEAFIQICLPYGSTIPVLATFLLCQSLTQAAPTGNLRLPLLQLPGFTPEIVRQIEQKHTSKSKEHISVQAFMELPAEQRLSLATAAGLDKTKLTQAEHVARQLPYLRVEKTYFKVHGEKHVLPSSLVQYVIKARFIPPGTKDVPPVKEEDLLDPDFADGDLEAMKKEAPQHSIPLAYAPYLPRDKVAKWHVFLTDNRTNKIAVPPFTFHTFDKKPFTDDGKPTFEVVTLKMQFAAPPQAGEYEFYMHLVCDSYIGFDDRRKAPMVVEDASKALIVDEEEDEISEPEEGNMKPNRIPTLANHVIDTIAGQMAALKGQATADPNKPKRIRPKREAESDYESGTDEDEDESETDTDTDSDAE